VVLVETVGVGQDEVEIAGAADVTVVVLVPGLGDEVQALKAGIMEIADVFAVNKADRDGVERTLAELESYLRMAFEGADEGVWRPPIVPVVARDGKGVDELVASLDEHRERLTSSGELAKRRRARVEHEVLAILKQRLVEMVLDEDKVRGTFQRIVDDVCGGRTTARAAAATLLDRKVD